MGNIETVSLVSKEWPINLTGSENVLGIAITNGEGKLIMMKNATSQGILGEII